jgi:multidrug efflux pump subunit AcrA (membrane-fusion protein)
MRKSAPLLFVLLAPACHKESDTAADPAAVVQVKTAIATIQPFEEKVGSIGAVNARSGHFASLSAPAPARITSVLVSPGQHVNVGQALVAFEQTPFVTAAQSAEAALLAAERAYERTRRLAEAGIQQRTPSRRRPLLLKRGRQPSTRVERHSWP